MTESSDIKATQPATTQEPIYDRKALTYSESFDSSFTRIVVKTMEWMTGKLEIIRRVRKFEQGGIPTGQAFWPATMKTMGIEVQTPQEQLDRIPETGKVVFVANHPHGLIDGMVLADVIGRRRSDYRILTRALLTGIDEAATSFMIPVPFPHEDNAQRKMIEMRNQAMAHLEESGLIALFPSGVVAQANSMFGPAVEAEWNVFTAKMIRKSGATVVPCFFPGANSRAYQIAANISLTLRQGLLIHEVVHAFDKPQAPVIGKPISADRAAELVKDPRKFMTDLRAHTMALGEDPDRDPL